MLLIASLFSLLGLALVSKSATSGQYSSIQAAVDALSTTGTTAQAIFINPGTYTEQVYIPARKAALTIYGYTTDTSSYLSNQVTITYGLSQLNVSTDDETATLRAWYDNYKMYNNNVSSTASAGISGVLASRTPVTCCSASMAIRARARRGLGPALRLS
jgi:pectinesterase